MKNENLNNRQVNDVLCKVNLFMIETDKRIIQVASKNNELSDDEKKLIEDEYGKIVGVYDVVGAKEAILLNFVYKQ